MALKLAFLWHMHQPFYKNMTEDSYLLPWVRLHALKDYYGMVKILRDFPKVHQNFNLVPSLLVQLQDYATENANEAMLELSLTPAADLKESDRAYLLRYFFYANKDNVIARFPKFLEMLEKRGVVGNIEDMERARAKFTVQDYLDLQVLQKLAWMDEEYLTADPEVSRLVEKGRNFDEADKVLLRKKELELMALVIPEYQAAHARGQVELSTTPFYHPILPLLVTSRAARESQPTVQLPLAEFSRPEDARIQIQRAVLFHETLFGERPIGMWPSEGSVSEHILPLLSEAGIRWIATDEEILLHSLEKGPVSEKAKWCAQNLYAPYERKLESSSIAILFRDHVLSDLIGFSYSRVRAKDAAEDFMKRLLELDQRISAENKTGDPPLISIILDGENAWEHYPNNGRDFLKELYRQISESNFVESTTIKEYLDQYPCRPLPRLYAGSWINHNFAIWIGHPEDNRGWDYLKEARDLIEYVQVNEPDKKEEIKMAYEEILIAEGSDWYWWFGDDHSSENDAEFDRLFRQHISNVYHILKKPLPESLALPIKAPRPTALVYRVPRRFVSPKLDGEVTNYFEWLQAGHYFVADQQGTMHRAETHVKQILFGFDQTNAYFRVDFQDKKAEELMRNDFSFQLQILPWYIITMIRKEDGQLQVTVERERDDYWMILENQCEVAVGTILEIKVPFTDLEAVSGDLIRFRVSLMQSDILCEEHPQAASIQFHVPGPHFEEMDWEV